MTCFRFMLFLLKCMKVWVVYFPHSSTQLTWVSCEFAPSVLFNFVYLKLLRVGSIVSCPGVPEIFQNSKNFFPTSQTRSPVSLLLYLSPLIFCCLCFIIRCHIQFPKVVKKFPPHYSLNLFYSELQIGVDTDMRHLLNYRATSIFLKAEISITLTFKNRASYI
jgi:hypothetical protein